MRAWSSSFIDFPTDATPMSPASSHEAATPVPRAPGEMPQRLPSAGELEIELVRHLSRSRRQRDQLGLLWIEVELLTRIGAAPEGGPLAAVAEAVGARMLHRVRKTDLVFQVGDVGFAVLLQADRAGVQLVKARLFEALRGPYGLARGLQNVYISIGMAMARDAQRQDSSLLQCAMDDLYTRPAMGPKAPVPAAADAAGGPQRPA
jgi:predicted signal transduction protein with EAL and GGDEF domain